jgi:hypothetical protein
MKKSNHYPKGLASHDLESYKQSRTASHDAAMSSRLVTLESQFDQLSLINEALWEILKKDKDLTDKDLINEVKEVVNLRVVRAKSKPKCNKCGMSNPKTKSSCIYCGDTLIKTTQESPFT